MPRATNNISDTTHVPLKTCEGGFVELRRMTYGQYLTRQQIAMDMSMQTNSRSGEANMQINMTQQRVAEFEFKHCIASHNLEDDQGNLLDFKSAHTLQMLDPRVGQEIGAAIDKMNTFEEEVGN